MFRIYSEHQNGKFYLSPYTDIMIDNDKLLIDRHYLIVLLKLIVSLHGHRNCLNYCIWGW